MSDTRMKVLQKRAKEGDAPLPDKLYEKTIEGTVRLACDGQDLFVGTTHGRRSPGWFAPTTWKWDIWPSRLGKE
jgi:hypothetical protein